MKKAGVLIIGIMILFGSQAVQAQNLEVVKDSLADQSTWSGLD